MALKISAHERADKETVPQASRATRATIAAGSRRAATTLLDQGFSSVSNFAMGVAVARVAGAAGLGAFAFAYAAWLVLVDVHRGLIIEPMAIEGDGRQAGTRTIERGFAAEVLLGSGATALFALVGVALHVLHIQAFATPMLFLAPWITVLLLQDYWRLVSIIRQRPGLALANDIVFSCAQGAAFLVIIAAHVHSSGAVISAWALGGLAGAAYGLCQYRARPTFRGGLTLIRSRWAMGRWLTGSSLISWGASQAYVYIAGALLGPAALGGLKASQALVAGPAGVLVQAGGSIGLPEASNAYAERGWKGLIKVTRVVTVAGIMSFVAAAFVLVLWGRELLSRIYGPQFAHMERVAVLLGVAYIVMSLSLGPLLVLKQTRNAHRILQTQIAGLVVSLVGVAVLTLRFGVVGTAYATIATAATGVVCVRWHQHVVGRLEVGRPAGLATDPDGEPAPTLAAAPQPGLSVVTRWRAARLRWRLRRPSSTLQLLERRLRAQLESTDSRALALVEINATGPAVLAIAALASSLASDGKRVVVADVGQGRPLGTLLGADGGTGMVRPVSIQGQPVGLLVAPDDPAQMAVPEVGDVADATLLLASADQAFGADHIAAWAKDAVVMVGAGRASTTALDAVRRQLREVNVAIRSGVLVGHDPDGQGS